MNKFRLNSTKLSLTYPQCPVSMEVCRDFLLREFPATIYMCVAQEKHQDGNFHLHVAVLLKDKCDIKSPTKLDLCADLARFHGNYQTSKKFDAWLEYVKKDHEFVEYGTYVTKDMKEKLKRKEKSELFLSKPVFQLVDDGDLSVMQAKTLESAKLAYYASKRIPNSDWNKDRKCIWIYGQPGCGKSAWVRQEYGHDLYYKTPDKWWDSYNEERNVILEDLDITKARELVLNLKLWADGYNFSAECKGGRKFMDYTGFYVTSNYLPHELWDKSDKDVMLVKAIKRRFSFYTTDIEDCEEFNVNLIKYDY